MPSFPLRGDRYSSYTTAEIPKDRRVYVLRRNWHVAPGVTRKNKTKKEKNNNTGTKRTPPPEKDRVCDQKKKKRKKRAVSIINLPGETTFKKNRIKGDKKKRRKAPS